MKKSWGALPDIRPALNVTLARGEVLLGGGFPGYSRRSQDGPHGSDAAEEAETMFAATARLAGIVFAGLLLAASAASAQETMKGGTITYAKPGEMISLDPHTSISGVDWRILYQIYEQLLSVNDDFTFGPGLATSWEQPTPTTYIFHLNKDSKFSNGRGVVASDVVGSLERVLDPETAAFWAVQLGKVKEIVADDDHTVRVEINRMEGNLDTLKFIEEFARLK